MTQEDLENYYYKQLEAYNNIFRKIGMNNFIYVQSDSGMMGGKIAHEFMAVTPDGEDELVICSHCDYKANEEVAECQADTFDNTDDTPCKEVFTGEDKTIEEICHRLNIEAVNTIKAVAYANKDTGEPIMVFLRGDLEVNESKLCKVVQTEVVPLDSAENPAVSFGNIGPLANLPIKTVIYDRSIENRAGMVIGANKPEYHIVNFKVGRDIQVKQFHDVAKVKQGQRCVKCGHELTIQNGIEIGNIFQLGTKYTHSMGMSVLNENGESIYPIMGCYGIGVGRAIASIIQNSYDANGMILPISVARWTVHICPVRIDNEGVRKLSFDIYDQLKKRGLDTLIDDRDMSPGVKFADADLMGMPIRLVVSPKLIASNEIEIKIRKTGEVIIVKFDELYLKLDAIIQNLMEEYR